jgi:hypothetical protein
MKSKFNNKYILLLILLTGIIVSCSDKNNMLFDESPNLRLEKAKQQLSVDLQAAPFGWKLVYFPAAHEDLAVANTNFTFLFKFLDSKNVQMKSSLSATRLETSEYELNMGTTLSLDFVTYNIIHDLANASTTGSGLGGKARDGEFQFLYFGKTETGDLIFRTNRANTEIRFEKATADDWVNLNGLASIFTGDFKSTAYALKANKAGTQVLDSIISFNTTSKIMSMFTKRPNAAGVITKVETVRKGFGYGTKAIVIMPGIVIGGKSFYFFEWDATAKKIISKIDDYVVSIEPTTDPKYL